MRKKLLICYSAISSKYPAHVIPPVDQIILFQTAEKMSCMATKHYMRSRNYKCMTKSKKPDT